MTRITSAGSSPAPGQTGEAKGRSSQTTSSSANTGGEKSSSAASPSAPAAASGAAGGGASSAKSDATSNSQQAPKQGLASAAVQAGSGDVMVRPAQRRPLAEKKVEDAVDGDDAPDDGPDMDADGPDAAGGFFGRVMQRGGLRGASRMAGADAGGDGDGGEGAKISGGADGGGSSSAKSSKRGRSKMRGGRSKGKSGASKGTGGGGRVRAAEGRDETEDVESVSVLVGQDGGGGDPVEQALNAHKRISGDDDEHKNAFTSNYKDNFDPTLEPVQVERLGSIQGAVHMVRLADHWESEGLDRQQIIEKTAQKLLGFTRQDQIKRTISEMNIAPIKNVYPLEVMLRILDEKPDFWPKVHRGQILQNRDELVGNRQIIAGHEFRVKYPEDYKIKSFALLGGGEPGYEFAPYKNGAYRMIIDAPGRWTFALSAEKKGEAIIDSFTVEVHEPGRVTEHK